MFNQLAARKGQINAGTLEFAGLGVAGGAALSGVAGGGASAGFIRLAASATGRTLLPVVAGAIPKPEALAEKFGASATQIANQALTAGTKLIDNLEANAGNINSIIPRLDGANGFIRVTTDPTQSRIISAGLQDAAQITNGIASVVLHHCRKELMHTRAREDLDALIDRFLAGQMPFAEFQQAYSDRFIDDNACAEFSVEEVDHYGAVHEKAEWTSPSPTAEDRSYGWIDPSEFKTWLGIHESHKPPIM